MNSFGRIFRVSIYGESHGPAVGMVIDGCPAGIHIDINELQDDLNRRKPGSKGTTTRVEDDKPMVLSGIFNSNSTGAPIHINFKNNNIDSSSYEKSRNTPRPGHADFVSMKKFGGYNDYRGSGHFSGRLTLGLVAAGYFAKKIINPILVTSRLIEAGGSKDIKKAVNNAIKNKDSIGGIIECSVENVPVGLGEPFFDSAESLLSHIIFSIPAIKGIEFGSGFQAAKMTGSQHNDIIIDEFGRTITNHSGGINGGITNGNDLYFRVAVKPASSIPKTQKTIDLSSGDKVELKIEGRHDSCIALRMPVIIEAATAIVLADLMMLENIGFDSQ